MKSINPKEYRQLKVGGRLEEALEALMGMYVQSVDDGQQAALNRMVDGKITADQLPMLFLEIEREAMEQVVEQIEAMTTSIDPEVMLAVVEMGAQAIAEGAVTFAQFVREVLTTTLAVGLSEDHVKPFLKEAYGAISANPERFGVTEKVADCMDLPREVRKADIDALSAEEAANGQENINQDGGWSEDFGKRVTAAIFAYGYDNQRLLEAATGETDEVGRNITAALLNNAVGMTTLRQHSPYRAKVLTNFLAEGIEAIVRNRHSCQSLQEMVAQNDLPGYQTSPHGMMLAEAIARNAESSKAITGIIGYILKVLNDTQVNSSTLGVPHQMQLFTNGFDSYELERSEKTKDGSPAEIFLASPQHGMTTVQDQALRSIITNAIIWTQDHCG
ncbi:hypothetical protein ACTG16_12020 [Aeromonas sp. 23P]|uniref:hypothetical protein n=1 Tax=unclassified Aeromonas TaxID=257493 RepID=UPI003F7AE750